jgi:hypothetical protein
MPTKSKLVWATARKDLTLGLLFTVSKFNRTSFLLDWLFWRYQPAAKNFAFYPGKP